MKSYRWLGVYFGEWENEFDFCYENYSAEAGDKDNSLSFRLIRRGV